MTCMIKCKQCGFEHPSIFKMDEHTLRDNIFSNNQEICSKCGKTSTYNKEDYYFK
jgi:hypothetical protein